MEDSAVAAVVIDEDVKGDVEEERAEEGGEEEVESEDKEAAGVVAADTGS